MKHSPFLANRQKKLARQAASGSSAATLTPPDPETGAGQQYATLVAVLHDQLRQLSDTQSIEARIPMKQKFAAEYRDWVVGVLEADEPVQDEILVTMMVWAIDCGYFAAALEFGRFASKHGLEMPERYNRSVACFLREEFAEAYLKDPEAVAHEFLAEVDELTAEADMPDQAKAKMNKALGRSWFAKAENFDASDDTGPAGGAAAYAGEAVRHFDRALKLDKKAGVKKNLEKAQRLQAKLSDAQEEQQEESQPS